MAALDQSSFSDMNTYHFLVIWKLTSQPVTSAGDQQANALGYWNDADLGESQQTAKSEANNLLLYCLTYATALGTQWLDSDESKRLASATRLASIMSTATSLVSDISAQLAKVFSFTSSAIPTPYATLFAQAAAASPDFSGGNAAANLAIARGNPGVTTPGKATSSGHA